VLRCEPDDLVELAWAGTHGAVASGMQSVAFTPASAIAAIFAATGKRIRTLPITDDGDVVLIRRAIEPGYGSWAQPGGFLEIDETAHEGAARETVEETGLLVEPTNLVGVYSRPQAAVVVICWEARIVGGEARPTSESLEVRAFTPAAIPWPHIAFQTSAWAISDWLRLRHPDLETMGAPRQTRWSDESA
jgi:ADP-ribose pyrophosphatase YjhB (NUDIX family)